MVPLDLLVNKTNRLDNTYIPDDLIYTDNNENNFHKYVNPNEKPSIIKEVYLSFQELQRAALKEGLYIIIDSGYRSYAYQEQVWNHNVKEKGLSYTKQYVAPPGASEHQTGLAVDIAVFINNEYNDNVNENYPEYQWMIENAYKYGFILRYPKGKESITGYNFEAWHFRYVGQDLALKLQQDNITLEEYHQIKQLSLLK